MTDVIDEGALRQLYDDFAAADLKPLWTEIGNLQPEFPQPDALPHRWAWSDLLPLAERAGDLVPVGRGGERRAIALANPGLGGQPFATPTLWAAIQYLGPARWRRRTGTRRARSGSSSAARRSGRS